MIRKGSRVRLKRDASGDLPKRYIGRTGKIIGRSRVEDGIQTWLVKFDDRKGLLTCWRDELVRL